jgi:hypothetical protein
MSETIIKYCITFFLGILLTHLVDKVTKMYKSEKAERKALRLLLQSNLTNLAYVCLELGYIMDFQLKSWCNMLEAYESLDGDDYIHTLDGKIKQLEVKKTGVL